MCYPDFSATEQVLLELNFPPRTTLHYCTLPTPSYGLRCCTDRSHIKLMVVNWTRSYSPTWFWRRDKAHGVCVVCCNNFCHMLVANYLRWIHETTHIVQYLPNGRWPIWYPLKTPESLLDYRSWWLWKRRYIHVGAVGGGNFILSLRLTLSSLNKPYGRHHWDFWDRHNHRPLMTDSNVGRRWYGSLNDDNVLL